MLIYNHNKELVGIDDETLHHLGYKTLASFLESYSDVAELFVKKPGYIHNFQNFPWIDFVLHADAEDTKAIIQNDKKHFSCTIAITPIYLSDAPEQEGYVVHLKHIKSLNGDDIPSFVREEPAETPVEPDFRDEIDSPLGAIDSVEPTVLAEPDTFDVPEMPPLDLPDINADGSLSEPPMFEPEPEPMMQEVVSDKDERPMLGDYINKDEAAYLDNLKTDKDYKYDPQIAADELGLPVDLIEEFIGDFIQQAHDFKESLFDAALKEDYDEVHILSHKLKGVAANLRIEDAFEVLSIINNSRDQTEIEANLKQFYRIIAKMEGKELPEFKELEPETDFETPLDDHHDDDIYDIGMLLDDTPVSPPSDAQESPMIDLPEEETADDEALYTLNDEWAREKEPELPEKPEEQPEELPALQEEFPPIQEFSAEEEEPFPTLEESPEEAAPSETAAPVQEEPPVPAVVFHYDIKKAANEIGLKEAFVKELVHEFVNEAKAKKPQILAAIEDGDIKKVQSAIFEFKGLADNLRMEPVAASLQVLLHSSDTATAKQETERLYAMLEQL